MIPLELVGMSWGINLSFVLHAQDSTMPILLKTAFSAPIIRMYGNVDIKDVAPYVQPG